MIAHEQERLSAYLDDELPAPARAAVETHLAGCAECRAVLARLAEVDTLAGRIPAEAPHGYFDGFAGRVTRRIEAHAPARRPLQRVPVWAWAAAAALLLTIIPVTVREGLLPAPSEQRAAPVTVAPAAPVAIPQSAPTEHGAATTRDAAAANQPAPATAVGDGQRSPVARRDEREQARSAGATANAPAPAGAAGRIATAEVRSKAEVGAEGGGFALAPRASPARGELMKETATEAEPSARPTALPPAAPRPAAARATASSQAQAAAPPAARDAAAGAPPEGAASARLADALEEKTSAAVSGNAATDSSEADFQGLVAVQAARSEEWRALRERWRAFAVQHAGARADEARVRVVECGLEAWRAGGQESDRSALLRDSQEYLARKDARQKPRVQALLQAAARR